MQHISKNQVKYVRSLQQKKVRDAEGVFVAEGHKCIEELIHYFPLKMLIIGADTRPTLARLVPDSCQKPDQHMIDTLTYEATATEIEQMSSLRTPQGSIAIFQRSSSGSAATLPFPTIPSACEATNLPSTQSTVSEKSGSGQQSSLILALDGVQDPGNLGTIIRTADWFGITDIVCSHDTADCWNPKVVQATMGALARVHVHYTNLVEYIGEVRGCAASRAASRATSRAASASQSMSSNSPIALSTPIYGTLLDGRNMYEENAIPQKQNGIIIMGNEGNGISPEVRQLITHPLFIPSYHSETSETMNNSRIESLNSSRGESLNSSRIESLNVAIATAVILAEFRRK